jgi:hypothetical protein
VRLWEVATRRFAGHLAVEQTAFVALTPDGQRLAVAQGNRLTLYEVAW